MNKGDISFIRNKLLPLARVGAVCIAESSSTKKWPDIWVSRNSIPKITITKEWMRQNTHERRKRLTHEFLHLCGLGHGSFGRYNFDTIPDRDTYSMYIYRKIIE